MKIPATPVDQALPVPGFISQQSTSRGRMTKLRLEDADTYDLTDPVLRETPLANCDFAMLFTYMHRRFGLPFIPGDDYKELSAGWLITTPDPNLTLLVRPSLSGAWNSFVPMVTSDLGQAILGEAKNSELGEAYRAALLDLLRPVNVRDQSFNALGKLDDDDVLMSHDESSGEAIYAVPFHPSCGWAMPRDLFGNAAWRRLCTHLRGLGDGEILMGRDLIIRECDQRVIEQLKREANRDIPAIVAALLSWMNERQDLVNAIGLSPTWIKAGHALLQDINAAKPEALSRIGNPDEQDRFAERVATYLTTFDHPFPTAVKNAIQTARVKHILDAKWATMLDSCGGVLPRIEYPEPYSTEGLRAIPEKLREAGHEPMAAFAEDLLRDDQGLTIFSYLVARAKAMTRQSEPEPESAPGL